MNVKDPFREFLIKKKNEGGKSYVKWDEEKNKWLKSLEELYVRIEKWLQPFQKNNLIKLEKIEIELSEPEIGSYSAPQLNIYIGNDRIRLIPKGTILLRSKGRVDMEGPENNYTLLLNNDWKEWNFVQNFPNVKLWKVNEESFKKAILDVING